MLSQRLHAQSLSSSAANEFGYVFADEVGFDINFLPGLELAQIRPGEGLGDQSHTESFAAKLGNGQAYPVQGHRAFGNHKVRDTLGGLEMCNLSLAAVVPSLEGCQTIDVASHEMTAKGML